MYRDDRGGWVPAGVLDNHKVVGTDFRGLPIVHIGRGRPNLGMIRLLQKDPNVGHEAAREMESPAANNSHCDKTGKLEFVIQPICYHSISSSTSYILIYLN